MFEDDQRAVDGGGLVLNEQFAVAVNAFDGVVILAGTRTYHDLAPFQCLCLKNV